MTSQYVQHDTDGGNAPIIIHRHEHAAPPVVVTEKSAPSVGLTAKALRALCRRGLAHTKTMDGLTVLRTDLEAFLRARSAVGDVDRDVKPANVDPEGAALERAGLRVVGRKSSAEDSLFEVATRGYRRTAAKLDAQTAGYIAEIAELKATQAQIDKERAKR